ncbi:flavodoxin domain-containing protein [Faecalicoccus acidiformans]|uniref:flavodoxin domain-containing protein n=1 Tax=Faecalicoccus acidiformans TaxID=915173 RepID=UPI00320B2077
MKFVIVYASIHHQNTKKIVDDLCECFPVDSIDLIQDPDPDVSSYDRIGLASGIYFGSVHPLIKDFVEKTKFRKDQKCFVITTAGAPFLDFSGFLCRILKKKEIECCGSFHCRGYDTYAIFGKIGGIAKGHPDTKDIMRARKFLDSLK